MNLVTFILIDRVDVFPNQLLSDILLYNNQLISLKSSKCIYMNHSEETTGLKSRSQISRADVIEFIHYQ